MAHFYHNYNVIFYETQSCRRDGKIYARGRRGPPHMARYEVLDHTADLMIRAGGATLAECCENLAYGMFDQTVDLHGVRPLEERTVDVTGRDPEDALYSFLAELLYIEEGDGLVLCEFHVTLDGLRIRCTARGEPLDRGRMHLRAEIKAVTYHAMEIDPVTPRLTVLFDV